MCLSLKPLAWHHLICFFLCIRLCIYTEWGRVGARVRVGGRDRVRVRCLTVPQQLISKQDLIQNKVSFIHQSFIHPVMHSFVLPLT